MLPFIFRGHNEPGMFIHALTLGVNNDLVSPAEGNAPPSEGSYVCVVPVKDFWRMREAEARRGGQWHYKDIEAEILGHVRARRAIIII